jgi:hypothetical protein
MRLYFNDDVDSDLAAIFVFLEGIGFNDSRKKMAIDVVKIRSILNGIRQDFPHKDGVEKASIFKKVAAFMVYFIAEKPIQSDITGIPNIPEEISRIPNHINTLIALFIAFAALHGASIHYEDGSEKTLSNKIKLSKHSFVDLIDALSSSSPVAHFKIASVFLEQLAYKSNPDCQYETFDF